MRVALQGLSQLLGDQAGPGRRSGKSTVHAEAVKVIAAQKQATW